jgi:hypothetical protein
MKTLTMYNDYQLIHRRNPFGSHSWLLRDAEGDVFIDGNVAVAHELKALWPDDDIVAAIVSTMYIGDPDAALHNWSLGDQHRLLSIGKRCRKLQTMTGYSRLDMANTEYHYPHFYEQRGYRALDHRRRRCIIA